MAKYYGTETGTFPTRLAPRNVQVPIDSRGELPPIGQLYDMISDLSFAQYQLLSYVREDARPAYEADYREGFGNDFGSELHRDERGCRVDACQSPQAHGVLRECLSFDAGPRA